MEWCVCGNGRVHGTYRAAPMPPLILLSRASLRVQLNYERRCEKGMKEWRCVEGQWRSKNVDRGIGVIARYDLFRTLALSRKGCHLIGQAHD